MKPVCWGASLLLLILPPMGWAAAFRLDDSASEVMGGTVAMKWESPVPRPGEKDDLVGMTVVVVRLDVSAFIGRRARIYHVLPAQPSGPYQVRWTTRGTLLPGELQDGGRALVFSGEIQSGRMEDTFRLQVKNAGEHVAREERLTFGFEIELEE
jgi:hypothetical protein